MQAGLKFNGWGRGQKPIFNLLWVYKVIICPHLYRDRFMEKRSLSVFMLAMINVAAICSVRNWPTIAEYGFSSLFFFLIATLIFFIPTSLVSAELATAWPKTGGVFVWVKEAFGHRFGFLAIWL